MNINLMLNSYSKIITLHIYSHDLDGRNHGVIHCDSDRLVWSLYKIMYAPFTFSIYNCIQPALYTKLSLIEILQYNIIEINTNI